MEGIENKQQAIVSSDLVSRKAVIKELHDMYRHCVTLEDWHINGADAIYRVEHMPSAQLESCEDAISRSEAIKAIETVPDGNWKSIRYSKEIRRLPSAEPEIIRCKDCKYYIPYEWMFDGLTRSSNKDDYAPDEIGCSVNDHNYPPCGFCSFAERRTDE